MPKASVWFISQSLELSVRYRSVYVEGDDVATLGCVKFGCDVMFLPVVTSTPPTLSVTWAAVVITWVTFTVKRSLADVNVTRWVGAAVTSSVDVEGSDPGSERVTEHYGNNYKQAKRNTFGVVSPPLAAAGGNK